MVGCDAFLKYRIESTSNICTKVTKKRQGFDQRHNLIKFSNNHQSLRILASLLKSRSDQHSTGNPLECAQNLSRKRFIIIRPKALTGICLELFQYPKAFNSTMTESIPQEHARQYSTGMHIQESPKRIPQSISPEFAQKDSTDICSKTPRCPKAFHWNIPESISRGYTRKHSSFQCSKAFHWK